MICPTCNYDRELGLAGELSRLCNDCRAVHVANESIAVLERQVRSVERAGNERARMAERRAEVAEQKLAQLSDAFRRATDANTHLAWLLDTLPKVEPVE